MKLLSPTVLLASLLGAATRVAANTEKAIFLGPEAIPIPNQSPSLADLRLNVLTPSSAPTLRTELGRVFPSDDAPEGTATWFLLRDLDEGTRYEVRVCWSAMV